MCPSNFPDNESLQILHSYVKETTTNATWVCAVSFENDLVPQEDNIGKYHIGLFNKISNVLNRAYCISHKPGRGDKNSHRWVLVADHQWSLDHRGDSEGEVIKAMLKSFWACSGYDEVAPASVPRGFLWEDAMAHSDVNDDTIAGDQQGQMLSQPYRFDSKRGIGLCGDWCAGFGVGYAWASGNELAKKIVEDAGIY